MLLISISYRNENKKRLDMSRTISDNSPHLDKAPVTRNRVITRKLSVFSDSVDLTLLRPGVSQHTDEVSEPRLRSTIGESVRPWLHDSGAATEPGPDPELSSLRFTINRSCGRCELVTLQHWTSCGFRRKFFGTVPTSGSARGSTV